MAGTLGETASEPVYRQDVNGVRRLVAAPGDPVPPDDTPVVVGFVTPPDSAASAVAPFDGYDELTEAEILDKLPDLSAEELESVRVYERAHQARGAIHRYGLVSQPVDTPKKRTRVSDQPDAAKARRKQATSEEQEGE